MDNEQRKVEQQEPDSKSSPEVLAPTRPDPENPKVRFLAMAALVIISVVGGLFGGWLAGSNGGDSVINERERVVLQSQGELIGQIAEDVGESVVSIELTVATQSFFGMRDEAPRHGTGIILDSDGLIVTNRHVLPDGVQNIKVILSDGTEFDDVSIIGRTPSRDSLDIAFLKINNTDGRDLKAATLGDSSTVEVGDSVVAIGNALGQFQNTVTYGIISGYGRNVQAMGEEGVENLENLFQTDAAVNPGNSGGPLVNLEGEVIGINTAAATGEAQNVSFAIPINDVSGLIETVKRTGELQKPYIGVMYIPVTNDVAEQFSLGVNRGAYVAPPGILGTNPIMRGGPAEKAGVQPGDIITEINNESIDQRNSLSSLINKHKVGDKITLTILRSGSEQKLDLTLEAAPAN